VAALQIHQIPCLEDNYGYLIHDPDAGLTATIDSPDATAIERG
jgi:hydroxyacylglutathione hydrolase